MLIIFLLIEITHGHIKMPMNALEVILNRKSIPIMDEPGPTSKQLKKIYQAGLRAPDHGGLQPWKFIEVSGDNRIELGKKFVSVTKKIKKNPSVELLNKVKKAPLRAPLIVIVIANIKKKTLIPEIEQILSAGAAAQNMMLASSSMGFHSIWRTGHLAFNNYINKALKLNKSDVVIGYLYMGSSNKKIPSIKQIKMNKFVKKLG